MSLSSEVTALTEELQTKRLAMKALFDGIDDLGGEKARERADAIKAANTELSDLRERIDEKQGLLDIESANTAAMKAMRDPAPGARLVIPTADEQQYSDDVVSAGAKSIRELLATSAPFAAMLKARGSAFGFRGAIGELAVKTLITSADLTPQADRLSRIIPYATEDRTTVGDLLLPGTTSGQKIEYFEKTTFTNAAAGVAEGEAKPESALDFTLREDSVRKIATWIPVTDEMLADVPAFESYLRNRLGFMVRQEEERQLLNGDGVAPEIQGILNRTGVQTVTGLGISTIDSIFAAITEVRADAFAEPNAMVVHPRDWFDIRTSKDSTGNYLLGPATTEGPEIVWGLRIVQTTGISQNTGLVGDFRQGQVYRRSGIEIAISTENEDYLIKNKLAVRAEERLALAVYRPAAFCKVESLVVGS